MLRSVRENVTPAAAESSAAAQHRYPTGHDPRLRYIKPYWWPYQTYVKERWLGRQLLEVISSEFRDRSVDYYRHALESGVTRINGVIASPLYVLKGSDRLDNTVHRHEPPVANDPVRVLHIDKEREFIVISKPGSVPVHATGRYFRHTVLEMLKSDYGIHGYAVNRLDRLTSGLMILALSSKASRQLADEFANKEVKKEYVARVKGKFPNEEITVDQPLLTVDRQMGLVIIAPEGKDAKTVFLRIGYDAERDESIVRCRPLTGRTHQIRVHLQFLGHPISNDPLYGMASVWGENLGQGGVDLVPEESSTSVTDILAQRQSSNATPSGSKPKAAETKGKGVDEETEMGNIELSSPIRLSRQAKEIIAKLRRMKDEAEDWVKWKEVIFTTQQAQASLAQAQPSTGESSSASQSARSKASAPDLSDPIHGNHASPLQRPDFLPPGFCDQCYVPLPDDPTPETLFIYLHALSYTTERLGKWATPMPRWTMEVWDGDWRGWADGQEIMEVGVRKGAEAEKVEEADSREADEKVDGEKKASSGETGEQ
ncbi:pseudouridine synthase [Dioszegia hungarica]|uniref:Pseudouridine synthase n=1 Tax=Dioszegia hungarica TaxID=4972 RepID=A0AA38H1C2_9TREE|nr:pseudouridine synthase [Dioszegia hungarica]KAI9631882.1 pseudouridine synthase [Dioszegia hungarica]